MTVSFSDARITDCYAMLVLVYWYIYFVFIVFFRRIIFRLEWRWENQKITAKKWLKLAIHMTDIAEAFRSIQVLLRNWLGNQVKLKWCNSFSNQSFHSFLLGHFNHFYSLQIFTWYFFRRNIRNRSWMVFRARTSHCWASLQATQMDMSLIDNNYHSPLNTSIQSTEIEPPYCFCSELRY